MRPTRHHYSGYLLISHPAKFIYICVRGRNAREQAGSVEIYILTAVLLERVASRPVISWLLWCCSNSTHTHGLLYPLVSTPGSMNRWAWRRPAVVFHTQAGDNCRHCYRLHYPRRPARYITGVKEAKRRGGSAGILYIHYSMQRVYKTSCGGGRRAAISGKRWITRRARTGGDRGRTGEMTDSRRRAARTVCCR